MEGLDGLERRWRWFVLLFWVAASALLLYARWAQINAFALGDTDDNMRIMQVREQRSDAHIGGWEVVDGHPDHGDEAADQAEADDLAE